jgi:hypothetical protein
MSSPDPAVVTAALERLAETLVRAQNIRQTHPTLSHGHTPERFAQQIAAKAFQTFLAEVGLGRFTDVPLALLEALIDLDRGNTLPLLEAAPVWGRPPPPLAVARHMARAARALDLLMLTTPRPSIEQAVQQVWRARSWTGVFDSAQAIISFRKKVRSGHAPADVLRLWDMPLPEEEAGTTRAEQAAWLLAMLAEG